MAGYLEKTFSITGKVSVVTGGARGIGYGIAVALAGAGSDVMLVARTEAQLLAAKQQLENSTGRKVETVTADLSRTDASEYIIEQALSRFGRIDILANNAGSNIRKAILEFSPEDFDKIIDIQLKSAFFTAQLAAREMTKTGGGRIINIASLTSKIGLPGIGLYGAAKGGVFAFTKAMATELAGSNINVNAVAPGYVRTAMTEAAFANEERYNWMLSRIPMNRFGTPEDIGNTVLFLASPAANYITGEVIYVDGGWMSA
ncbi:MAG: SDR family NAD(P)-dependent oxidoreductase [Desulfopila sp.]